MISLADFIRKILAELAELHSQVGDHTQGFEYLKNYTEANPVVTEEVVDGITYHHIRLHWMWEVFSLKVHLVTNTKAFNLPEIKFSQLNSGEQVELFLRSGKLIVNPLQEGGERYNYQAELLQPIFTKLMEII